LRGPLTRARRALADPAEDRARARLRQHELHLRDETQADEPDLVSPTRHLLLSPVRALRVGREHRGPSQRVRSSSHR